MSVVDNRTTRKDNYNYQTTIFIYDQNSISTIKKIITKSSSPQIKLKRNNLTYNSLEKNMGPVLNATENRSTKKSKEVRSSNVRFYF